MQCRSDGAKDWDVLDAGDSTLYLCPDANMHVTALVGPGGDVAERYLYDPYGDAAVTDGSAGCAAAQGCTAEGGCATTESAGRASGGRRRGARATSPGGATGAADVLLGCGLRGVLGPDGRTVCRARRGRPGVEPPAEPRAPGGRGGDSGGRRYEYDGTSRRIKAAVDSQAPAEPDGVDAWRHFYYNADWQVLETRRTTVCGSAAPG